MTQLTIWPESGPTQTVIATTHRSSIADVLATVGVHYERWTTRGHVAEDTDHVAVLAAYTHEIERLSRQENYQAADVIRLARGTADTGPMRTKFLSEHTHNEDEVRFFVEGSGAFYLHIAERVHQLICTAGDLISVRANTRHWFDMGSDPYFVAIRLFTNPEGWVARYTGDAIAQRFPLYVPGL